MWQESINHIKFEDIMRTLEANSERLSGMHIYCIEPFAAGTKISVRGYSPDMRGKELVGLDVIKEPENVVS